MLKYKARKQLKKELGRKPTRKEVRKYHAETNFLDHSKWEKRVQSGELSEEELKKALGYAKARIGIGSFLSAVFIGLLVLSLFKIR